MNTQKMIDAKKDYNEIKENLNLLFDRWEQEHLELESKIKQMDN